jgi:hypothetical protein
MTYRNNRYRTTQVSPFCGDNVAFGFDKNQPAVAPKLGEYARLQAYAAACFAAGTPHHNDDAINRRLYGYGGRYPWMDIKATGKSLGMSERMDGSLINLIALEPDRGDRPLMCPEGSVCSANYALGCTAPATVGVYLNREYAMTFTCNDHVNAGISYLKRARWDR